jgi:hypothetical protein
MKAMPYRSVIFTLFSLLLPGLSAAQQWQNIAPMLVARTFSSCAVLHDGRILVAGGENGSQSRLLDECEIYDPATNSWTVTGKLNLARSRFMMATLPNGKVIAAGGLSVWAIANTATSELYDPATGHWTLTASLSRAREVFNPPLMLPDGTALFIGGFDGDNNGYLNNVDRYDYRTETMIPFPSMPIGCWSHNYIYSPELNGVVVAGGNFAGDNGYYVKSTQFYSFKSNSWMLLDSLVSPATGTEQILAIPDSGVYLFSGRSSNTTNSNLIQRFNLKSLRWEIAGTTTFPTDFGYSFQINDDSILTIRGYSQPFDLNTFTSSTWFSLSKGTSSAGPNLIPQRTFEHPIVVDAPDLESFCGLFRTIYSVGGVDTLQHAVSTCEAITFKVTRSESISLSPPFFTIYPCEHSTNNLELSDMGCRTTQLNKIEALDSGTAIVSLDSLPMKLSNAPDTLHFRTSSLSASTIVPIRLTFSGPSGIFSKFVYLTQNPSANIFPLSLPTNEEITGSLCDDLDDAITFSNHSCSTVQILGISLSGTDSNEFAILSDSMKSILTPGDSATAVMACKAKTAGTYQATLNLHITSGGTLYDTSIQLTANISGSRIPVQLRMTDVENDTIGDTISVPVRIYGGNNNTVDGFSLDMQYNTKLLNLLPPAIQKTNAANTYGQEIHHETNGGLVTVEGSMVLDPTLPLLLLRFVSMPTDSICTILVLTSCSFTDTSQDTLCPPIASLDSVQICLIPSRSQVVESTSNQPFAGISNILVRYGDHSLVVTYSSSSTPRFSLVDELGRSYELHQGQPLGHNTSIFSLDPLATGFYLLQMRTASESFSKAFIYLK